VIGYARLAVAAIALGAVAYSYWWTYTRGERAGAAEVSAAFARAQDIALRAREAEQGRITKEQQDAAIRGQRARDDAELARAAADDAVARLHRRARDLAARSCPGAAAAANGQATGGPDVFPDVLRRLAEAGGRAAAGRDRDRAALAECEQRYDALRGEVAP
jgi:hypothetical protein